MSEIKVVGRLEGGVWDKRHDSSKRVYSVDGIAPTLFAVAGGGIEVKILVGGGEVAREIVGWVNREDRLFAKQVTNGVSGTAQEHVYFKPNGISDALNRSRVYKLIETKKIFGGNVMKTLKVNDIFAGCGGMGIGFKQGGFEIAGAWDFDKYAVQSYKHNVGDHVQQADISQMTFEDMPKADVWTFGFPCQDLSVAGKQAGLFEGKRSGLFFEVMRLLDETIENDINNLPSIIMAENVKGLKPYLEVLEQEYKQRGYKMYYTLYNSKYWGVPQNRERYFVVGIHESIDKEFVFPIQQEHYIPRLSTVLESEVDEKYYIDPEKTAKIIEQARAKVELNGTHAVITPDRVDKRQNGRRAKEEEEESYTLTAQDRHGVILKTEGINTTKNGKEFHSMAEQSRTLCARDYKGPSGAQPFTMAVETKIINVGNTNPSGKGMNGQVIHEDGISTTLTTNKGEGIKTMMNDFRIRKLTPREYARLQGFPESYEIVVSNSQAYKQFGNAVTVNVVKAIAERMKMFLLSL